jgi:hypothetical protein
VKAEDVEPDLTDTALGYIRRLYEEEARLKPLRVPKNLTP